VKLRENMRHRVGKCEPREIPYQAEGAGPTFYLYIWDLKNKNIIKI